MWQKKLQKYGYKSKRQQYKCTICGYQFCNHAKKPKWINKAYQEYFVGKQTLKELQSKYNKSIPTIRKYFDAIEELEQVLIAPSEAVNLILDATFFKRSDGVLVFRANKKNLFWDNITSETIAVIGQCLSILDDAGYKFRSLL